MENEIINFKTSKLQDPDVDVAVVIVLSHGNASDNSNTVILGTDGVSYPVDDILEQFSTDKCQNMKDKPKIFIFQCCRSV